MPRCSGPERRGLFTGMLPLPTLSLPLTLMVVLPKSKTRISKIYSSFFWYIFRDTGYQFRTYWILISKIQVINFGNTGYRFLKYWSLISEIRVIDLRKTSNWFQGYRLLILVLILVNHFRNKHNLYNHWHMPTYGFDTFIRIVLFWKIWSFLDAKLKMFC